MDGLSLISCGFCHAFRRTSGRCSQKNAHSFALKELNHRINGGRLPGAGSSGQHQQTMLDRFYHSTVLHSIQCDMLAFFHFAQALFHHLFRHLAVDIQIVQHFCGIQFQIIIMCRIDADFSLFLFTDYFALHAKIHDIFFSLINLYSQNLRGTVYQNLLGQKNMPFSDSLLQNVE